MASQLNLQLSKVTADLCMIVKEVKINKLFYVVRCHLMEMDQYML